MYWFPGTSYLLINQKILNDYGITIDDIHPYYMNYSESAEALANGDIVQLFKPADTQLPEFSNLRQQQSFACFQFQRT